MKMVCTIIIKIEYLLYAEVPSFVILHVSFGSETLATPLGTHERSFVGVDQHVDAQVLFFRECLAT